METISFTKLRQTLKDVLERVEADREPVLITRGRNSSAVLMSLQDYRSIEETAYLLRSPRNAERLRKSLLDAKKGLVNEHALIEED
jgi:antitoxin YefM